MGPGSTITFRQREKEGPVIATAECYEGKEGSSKIQMIESNSTILLDHIPRKLLVISAKTTFVVAGRKYCWKGYNTLFDEKTDRLIAQFTPVEGDDNVTGELIVGTDKADIETLIIMSAFIMRHRSEARRRAVYLSSECC